MTTLVLDFDSTFVTVESLDELGRIALRDAPDRAERVAEIERITKAAMAGQMQYSEALGARLRLFEPKTEQVMELVQLLHRRLTPSVAAHRAWIEAQADRILIVSGGFCEYIVPVVREFGIGADHILANRFAPRQGGELAGCDTTLPLAHDGGKAEAIRTLELEGTVTMVGDGYTDWQVREAGVADRFVAFVENVDRPAVRLRADVVARDFGRVVAEFEAGKLASYSNYSRMWK